MVRLIAVRLLQAAITLVAVSAIVFYLARLSGNPVDMLLPLEATPEQRTQMIHDLGLDRPLWYQYGVFLKDAVQGDFGTSLRTRKPAIEIVSDRLVNSLKLTTAAMAFAVLISLPLGVFAAAMRDKMWDKVAMLITLLGQSLPVFWTGAISIIIFAVVLGLLPSGGMGGWSTYVLPAVTMGWFVSAGLTRLLRSSMLDVLDSEYVKFARSKGVSERSIIWKHALRNALIPVLTFTGLMYGIMVASSITAEVVFNWPGLGRLTYEAVLNRDFPVLQLVVLVWAGLVIALNLVIDIIYGFLDPRIRV